MASVNMEFDEEKDDNKKLTYEDYMFNHIRKKYKRRKKRKGSQIYLCFFFLVDKLRDVVQSDPGEYSGIKTVLGFPTGALLAFGLYLAVLAPLNLQKDTSELVGGLLGLGLATGYAISAQVRCIAWLLIPTFFGKKGRSFIGTYAIVFLIAGPIHNIIVNGREVIRSLTCAAELAINQTSAKWELRTKPFRRIMTQFVSEGAHLKKVTKKIDAAYQPIRKELKSHEESEEYEIEDEDSEAKMAERMRQVDKVTHNRRGNRMQKIESENDESTAKDRAEKSEKRYRKKLEMRCEDVWNKAVIKCRGKFRDLERKCLSTIPVLGYVLCLPLKLTIFCQLAKVVPNALGMECKSMDVMEPGFGDVYVTSEDTMVDMEENFDVNLQYKMVKTPEDIDYTMAEEVRKGTMHEFDKKKVWVEFFMATLQRFMAFTFIVVIVSSYKYNKNYLTDFKFDNNYISSYFRHIDARRHYQNKRTLLPLKNFEKDSMIYPDTLKLMKGEKKKLSTGTFLILMRAFISGMIVMSANLLYDVMDIIEKNSHISYRQTGLHYISVKVAGVGFMSQIIRLFLKAFNSEHTIDNVTTNFECLPYPTKLNSVEVYKIYAVYIVVWILMLFEAYGLRLRRLICAFFYRKREKSRILFMYNELLKRRKGYLIHLRKKVRKQARKFQLSRDSGILVRIKRSCPKLASLVKRFKASKTRCLICDDLETEGFVLCSTLGCNFSYCADCWIDCKKKCYACVPRSTDFSDSDNSDDGSTEDDDV
ncbi:E3 ubiquitin-protein ligase DCST1-like [Saccostrea echinata]|uniref:E3 ubiquitin-protein ligase DCST1-like n=1 Tax=Saccostrea echinata TaxID=191078 RepID=UPI002A80987A|nr:E3 ubiquitin-protein ligase DCST1-like [Saccostrea echinata]